MKTLIQGIFLIFLSACSSNIISFYVVDENRIKLSTFSFYERKTNGLTPEQEKFDSLIEQSISEALISKGYIKQSYSDVYVSYNINIGTISSSNIEDNQYSNYNYSPYQNINTTHYKEGVLLIEVFSKQDKLLWQGSKAFKVRKSFDTKELLIEYAKEITNSFKSNL